MDIASSINNGRFMQSAPVEAWFLITKYRQARSALERSRSRKE